MATDAATLFDAAPPSTPASTTRKLVPLTDSEADAASAVAEREGLRRGPWIAKVVRMVLADVAEPSPAELHALVGATAEMRALTLALGRLTRALERSSAGTSEERPGIAELAAVVGQLGPRLDAHAETTARALRASHERWAIRSVRSRSEPLA